MKIALTGSSGRIGRAIHFELCREHEVIGLDRSLASVTSLLGDLCDDSLLYKAFTGADAVIHTAALHAPHVGIVDDSEFARINIGGTRKLIRAARECGVKNIVYTSTTALYGHASHDSEQAAWLDEYTPPQPRTIYHRSKLEAEQLLEEAAGPGLQLTILRMSRCFPEPAPVMAAYRLHRGIDARDVASAHRLALEHSENPCRKFIISGKTPFTPADCPDLLKEPGPLLRARCPELCQAFDARGWRLPDSIDRVYDASLAQQQLGWSPRFGYENVLQLLDEGISEVLPGQTPGNLHTDPED